MLSGSADGLNIGKLLFDSICFALPQLTLVDGFLDFMKVFKQTGLAIFLKILTRDPVAALFAYLNRLSMSAPMPGAENISGLLVDQSLFTAAGSCHTWGGLPQNNPDIAAANDLIGIL